MDSVTRAALLAAMTAAPAESVASVSKPNLTLATAETRIRLPSVASVSMFPAKHSNPAEMPPPGVPGWEQPEPVVTDPDFPDAIAPQDYHVSLETLEARQQTADSCGSPVLPSENPAGNAGNKPHDLAEPFDVALLETPELIGWLELRYGGKVALGSDGPVWKHRATTPPAEVAAVMKERRLAVQAVLLARGHAAKTRTREPDGWSAADWLAYFHERAGIREHDGHTPRQESERLALADCVEHWLRRNSPAPHGPENGCWQCGHAGHDEADPLANRICRGGAAPAMLGRL